MGGWMDGQVDGWMDGWVDEWMDGRMEGSLCLSVCPFFLLPFLNSPSRLLFFPEYLCLMLFPFFTPVSLSLFAPR